MTVYSSLAVVLRASRYMVKLYQWAMLKNIVVQNNKCLLLAWVCGWLRGFPGLDWALPCVWGCLEVGWSRMGSPQHLLLNGLPAGGPLHILRLAQSSTVPCRGWGRGGVMGRGGEGGGCRGARDEGKFTSTFSRLSLSQACQYLNGQSKSHRFKVLGRQTLPL